MLRFAVRALRATSPGPGAPLPRSLSSRARYGARATALAAAGSAVLFAADDARGSPPRALHGSDEPDFWKATENQVRRQWQTMTGTPESRLLWGIVGINAGIYLLWKITNPAHLSHFMYRHFTTTSLGLRRGRLHTLVTSSFSHMGIFHFSFNMYPLVHFGSILMVPKRTVFVPGFYGIAQSPMWLSRGDFLYLYLLGAVLGAVVNSIAMTPFMWGVPSLGASNAIFAIVTYFCLLMPDSRMRVMFSIETDAATLAKALMYINAAGAVVNLLGVHTGIAWAGHLGGMAAAYWFYGQRRRALGDRSDAWYNHPLLAPLVDATYPRSLIARLP